MGLCRRARSLAQRRALAGGIGGELVHWSDDVDCGVIGVPTDVARVEDVHALADATLLPTRGGL
jgi:hypothetical protein